jgi:hypothetical protein
MTDFNPNTSSTAKRLTSRRRWILLALTLLALVCTAVIIALAAPGVVLQILSFAPRGSVESFWQEVETVAGEPSSADALVPRRLPESLILLQPTAAPTLPPSTPTPAPTMNPASATTALPPTHTPSPPTITPSPTESANPFAGWFSQATVPSGVVLSAEGYLRLALSADDTFASALWFGESVAGESLGIVELHESAIPALCSQIFNNCRTDRYRIDRVDFRPGGLMVYGSINLGVGWQSLGVALLLDDSRRSLRAAGVIVGDAVYQVPSGGPIASILSDLAARGNAALERLRVQGAGYDLGLTELFFDDDRFIAVLG